MQDTFWIKSTNKQTGESSERKVLRTHTSSVQIRFLENNKPPIRIIVPGKVFRNEATDATHEAQFFQVEALYVDKNVSLAHLKGTLENMFKKLFGDDVEIRFRPSFFPFTEPSVEVDMKWKGKWLEMGGAGLVNPKVFEAVGVDPKEWQGFAFGFGIDRLVMLKFGIDDVRYLYNGDLRLINQF
jgi:phenylalanyl-tRNA synthetase alpha chain